MVTYRRDIDGLRVAASPPGSRLSSAELRQAREQIRVLPSPARRNRAQNPYNFLLSQALSDHACEVVEADRRNSLLGRADIFHVHWPQGEAQGHWPRALGKSL